MGKHRIGLGGKLQGCEAGGQFIGIAHFDCGHILEAAVLAFFLRADAVGDVADLAGNVAEICVELLPLRGNAGVAAIVVGLLQARHQHGRRGFKTGFVQFGEGGGVHADRLHKIEIANVPPVADLFRRHAEMIAEGTGEGFMRVVARIKGDCENAGCAIGKGQRPRRSGAAPGYSH